MVISLTMYPCTKKFHLMGKVEVLGPNVAKKYERQKFLKK